MSVAHSTRRRIAAALVALAALALALFVWRGRSSGEVEVYPVSNVADYDWNSYPLSGTIEAGKVQEVTLANGIVNEMRVREGDAVRAGDVLMVYDTESYQITLLADQARIASLEASIQRSQREVSRLSRLRPSEEGSGTYTKTIDHGELKLVNKVASKRQGVPGARGGSVCDWVFLCTSDAVVELGYLQELRASGESAEFKLYQDDTLYGSWIVDGASLPAYVDHYEPVEGSLGATVSVSPADEGGELQEGTSLSVQLLANGEALGEAATIGFGAPDVSFAKLPTSGDEGPIAYSALVTLVTGEGEPIGEPVTLSADQGEAAIPGGEGVGDLLLSYTEEPSEALYRKQQVEALSADWPIGDNVEFGDTGAYLKDTRSMSYGQLVPCTPETYERYETVEIGVSTGNEDDFVYSRAEIAQMISDLKRDVVREDLDLRQARLTYQKDQITAQTGEVKATIDGTVSKLVPVDSAEVGSPIITVRGEQAYTLLAYIDELSLDTVHEGDELLVYSYESGTSATARVTGKRDTPVEGGYGYGQVNPNSSWYPVQADIVESDGEFKVGEYCDVQRVDTQASDDFYLPTMFVREDAQGRYVMAVGEDGRLERRAVVTGKTLWGSSLQIISGVSTDDSVAFPYGTQVVEGAPTVEKDYPEY